MYLIYINRIGTTFKGEHMFEFLFSNSIEWEWDESWYESSVILPTKAIDILADPLLVTSANTV